MRLPLFVQRLANKNKPPLKLYWWRYEYPDKLNFGDEVSRYVIEKLWGRACEWAGPAECELAGAGSIIEMLQGRSQDNEIKIWGSGFMRPGEENTCANLDFYAVRGQRSRSRVRADHPIALGDPAILGNRVFKRAPKATHKVGLLAHYVDAEHEAVRSAKDNENCLIINPLDPPAKVAAAITSCECVFSSSLHGLIFADSFGVPNYWLPLSDKVSGGSYKFEDYYSSTGRVLTKQTPSVLQDPSAIEQCIRNYQPVKALKKLQRDLIKSFPY